MNCPKCKSSRTKLNWVAMEWWDCDSWSCFECNHTWAG